MLCGRLGDCATTDGAMCSEPVAAGGHCVLHRAGCEASIRASQIVRNDSLVFESAGLIFLVRIWVGCGCSERVEHRLNGYRADPDRGAALQPLDARPARIGNAPTRYNRTAVGRVFLVTCRAFLRGGGSHRRKGRHAAAVCGERSEKDDVPSPRGWGHGWHCGQVRRPTGGRRCSRSDRCATANCRGGFDGEACRRFRRCLQRPTAASIASEPTGWSSVCIDQSKQDSPASPSLIRAPIGLLTISGLQAVLKGTFFRETATW